MASPDPEITFSITRPAQDCESETAILNECHHESDRPTHNNHRIGEHRTSTETAHCTDQQQMHLRTEHSTDTCPTVGQSHPQPECNFYTQNTQAVKHQQDIHSNMPASYDRPHSNRFSQHNNYNDNHGDFYHHHHHQTSNT